MTEYVWSTNTPAAGREGCRWTAENLRLCRRFGEKVVPPEGFEPSTSRSGGARSDPLSYEGTDADCSTLQATATGAPPAAPIGLITRVAQALAIAVESAG